VQLNPDLSAQTYSRVYTLIQVMKLSVKLAILLTLVLSACGSVFAQESDDPTPPRVGIAEIYLAKDDGSGKAGDQATSFITTDIPIYCVVLLDSAQPVKVKMNLVAVAVAGVKAETRVVSTTYTMRENEDRVNFTGRPVGQWVAGRYRVDIFVGDGPAVSSEFAVQKAAQAKPGTKPAGPGPKPADKSRLAGPVKKV
jgi:hypothetical protein